MQIVPLTATPSQEFTTVLQNQATQLVVYQKFSGLFMDVYVNDTLIIGGVICQNKNRIVRSAYLGYIGDFAFLDMQGNDDPEWDGLGSRFLLFYLSATELETYGVG